MSKKIVIFLGFLFLLSGCSHQYQIKKWREQQKKSVIHKQDYWRPYTGTPLEDRMFPADKDLIEYLNRANKIDGYPPEVKPVVLSQKEKRFFKKIINDLPKRLRSFVDRHLKGVFIVDDLGGSGLTDGIFSEKETSFIVFDRKVFNKKANDWCTWKEHSVFKKGDTKLECVIRKGKENNEMGAFQFIFMHELAHVINRGFKEYLPFWEDDVPESFEKYPYLKISWAYNDKKMVRKNYEEDFKKIWFYGPEDTRKENQIILSTYEKLKKTRFPSLYGVINAFDDFAEAFVIYHHTQILKKPYEIRVTHKGKTHKFKSCIQENRCPKKAKLVRALFKSKLK